ncbi:ATP-dependent DNA helicase [Actinotalea sp. AC32]|nr:ATP-dependent DNA helicase [Actinotalea sp. AC32]
MTVTDTGLGAVDVARLLGLPEPTPEQVAVIEAPLEPVLVVAGAGSGKTETMSARVVHLIANGLVEPDRILGLTFTRKAAGELSERVRRRLRALRRAQRGDGRGAMLVTPTISTYNSYAAGLVGEHAMRLGVEPSSRLLGEAARWQLAQDVVEHWVEDLAVDLAPGTVTEAVLDLAGALAEHLRTPDELRAECDRLVDTLTDAPPGDKPLKKHAQLVTQVRDSLALRSRLVDLVVEFTARKREADLVDFADQVAIAARLARDVPEVGAAERSRYGVVLLDEYQDTSVAQLTLLGHLFGGASARPGHPVTAVGDPHQSIYGWRGASAGGLERFPEQFPAVDDDGPRPAAVLALSTSWRNDHAVLDAANVVAAPLRTPGAAVELPVLAARPGAGTGTVDVAMLDTVEDEARAVAEFVVSRRAALATGRADGSPVTAAVLCRKRSQFAALHLALVEAGLPVEVVGLGGLLSAPEVVDLVATLEVVHDPSRGDSLMRLLTGPRMRLGLADLHALGEWATALADDGAPGRRRGRPAGGGSPAEATPPDEPLATEADVVDDRSIVDALDSLPRPGWRSRNGRTLTEAAHARLLDLGRLLRHLRQHTSLAVVDLVAEAERMLGLDIEVAAVPGRRPATARANLDAFRAVAASFAQSAEVSSLGAFLAWLDAAQEEERGLEAPVAEMDPDAVQLLTVHASKGLEWDVVAVPGLVEKSFPDAGRTSGWTTERGSLPTTLRGDRDNLPDVDLTGAADLAELHARLEQLKTDTAAHQLHEERRLAYVAVTRARSALLLTGSWWRDGVRPATPSRFLVELDESPDVRTERLAWAPDPAAPGEDGAARTPVRPPAPEVEPPLWPQPEPLGAARQRHVERAAAVVRAAAASDGPPLRTSRTPLDEVVDLLVDERRRVREGRSTVHLPAHLSASAVVRLAEDAEQFARQLRRPVPQAPSVHARRGTAFHAWVERWYGRAALLDVDALPGADDETVGADDDLARLQQTFLDSEWAGRVPSAVEVDVETPVGGVVVRSRIDAVFPEADGGVVVVDWKTGRPPTDPDALEARELQLAVYRLAWARWRGVPLEKVRAAFYYVGSGETVRPRRLLAEADLEALVRRAGAPG